MAENSGASTSSYAEVEDSEDKLKMAFSSDYKESQATTRIPHGIVISGEASESDEEIDTHQTLPQSGSDFSISEAWGRSSVEADKDSSKDVQYNSLLHKKLREKNGMLRKDLVEFVTQPYESASKEIHTISQQLIKSQLLVQDLRNTIRRLTNDLFEMEDKMEALRTGSFLPEMCDPPTTSE
ncbi:hypothetical protein JTE90_026492 [Oedothorax gibbosus]|uniref:Biogenesis of lysosome-related organelles complex 1 subunit 3 n=1 Tax=Oedothorax gibbosus TaxID=931172 RepID=A0AAV6VSD4_9ARAC|nr:hypothetical protein JTE90_026492 [Oedothorax gibbosus]